MGALLGALTCLGVQWWLLQSNYYFLGSRSRWRRYIPSTSSASLTSILCSRRHRTAAASRAGLP